MVLLLLLLLYFFLATAHVWPVLDSVRFFAFAFKLVSFTFFAAVASCIFAR